jgi:hypothetical protein
MFVLAADLNVEIALCPQDDIKALEQNRRRFSSPRRRLRLADGQWPAPVIAPVERLATVQGSNLRTAIARGRMAAASQAIFVAAEVSGRERKTLDRTRVKGEKV